MLTLNNVRWKTDDGDEILKGIDLQLNEGKLTVVTGPNGAGKSTLAKVVAGINDAASGQLIFNDTDITHMDITERAKMGISFAFQQPVRFKGITVRDLLDLSAGGRIGDEKICGIMAKVGLCTKDYIEREVNSSLSGGEMKRIEIASVLAREESKLLIFDEPEAGIDLWSFNGLCDAFEELKKEEKTLLVISHQERLLEIADEIVVMAEGKVRISGPREEIMPQLLAGEKSGTCPIGREW